MTGTDPARAATGRSGRRLALIVIGIVVLLALAFWAISASGGAVMTKGARLEDLPVRAPRPVSRRRTARARTGRRSRATPRFSSPPSRPRLAERPCPGLSIRR